MPKSKDAFRTISEVADWLETPAHVLRFWESKFTQVKPVKRAGGRRYYRPADMKLLGGIKKLLHDDGLTIKGAQKLLREHGVKHVAALSQPLEEDLDEEIIEEAAFEADAQPEPEMETPATVLSFPSRTDSQGESEPPEDADGATEVGVTASEAENTEGGEKQDQESAAFGDDALPAFLRRTAPEPAKEATDTPKSLTIDPVARFAEPEPETEDDVADQADDTVAETAPDEVPTAPIFSHRQAAEGEDAPDAEPEEHITAPQPPAIDVPSIAKVAPALDSYDAAPGVLTALPGTRRLSPELAAQIGEKLTELRALRDRMQG